MKSHTHTHKQVQMQQAKSTVLLIRTESLFLSRMMSLKFYLNATIEQKPCTEEGFTQLNILKDSHFNLVSDFFHLTGSYSTRTFTSGVQFFMPKPAGSCAQTELQFNRLVTRTTNFCGPLNLVCTHKTLTRFVVCFHWPCAGQGTRQQWIAWPNPNLLWSPSACALIVRPLETLKDSTKRKMRM